MDINEDHVARWLQMMEVEIRMGTPSWEECIKSLTKGKLLTLGLRNIQGKWIVTHAEHNNLFNVTTFELRRCADV